MTDTCSRKVPALSWGCHIHLFNSRSRPHAPGVPACKHVIKLGPYLLLICHKSIQLLHQLKQPEEVGVGVGGASLSPQQKGL